MRKKIKATGAGIIKIKVSVSRFSMWDIVTLNLSKAVSPLIRIGFDKLLTAFQIKTLRKSNTEWQGVY